MDIRIKKEMSADYRQIEEPERFPSSYIFQLTKTGIRNPVCTLIRAKDGVCVYRVKSEGKRLILKVFEKEEDTREIQNYLILSELGIPTLPLLGYTENAILLPDVEASDDYRLGVENDMGGIWATPGRQGPSQSGTGRFMKRAAPIFRARRFPCTTNRT